MAEAMVVTSVLMSGCSSWTRSRSTMALIFSASVVVGSQIPQDNILSVIDQGSSPIRVPNIGIRR